jgi:3-phosphoshikimate 1-carboxyvinyltransferase
MLENEFEFDFSNCPDLAQTVVVTCLGLNLPCFFTGLKTLKIKETDRLLALKKECEKLGGRVEITNETLRLIPGELKVSAIDTYNDHRMAMAFAPLSLKIDGLIINDEHVVKKSYPTFWSDFSKV